MDYHLKMLVELKIPSLLLNIDLFHKGLLETLQRLLESCTQIQFLSINHSPFGFDGNIESTSNTIFLFLLALEVENRSTAPYMTYLGEAEAGQSLCIYPHSKYTYTKCLLVPAPQINAQHCFCYSQLRNPY